MFIAMLSWIIKVANYGYTRLDKTLAFRRNQRDLYHKTFFAVG